jgi:endonuclease YncB( thermonuclease family)
MGVCTSKKTFSPGGNPPEPRENPKPSEEGKILDQKPYPLDRKRVEKLQDCNWDNTTEFSLAGRCGWGKVVDVYDGDTFRVAFYLHQDDPEPVRFTVRGAGYDTPEMYPAKDHPSRQREMARARVARNRLLELVSDVSVSKRMHYSKSDIRSMLERNRKLVFLKFGKFEKYGRLLASVYMSENSEASFGQMLIDEKLAVPYDGGKKQQPDQKTGEN